jgi:regulator of sigma E protease
MNFLINSVLAFIFVLGVAVVLHEFGHFIVAKLLGIRVETFSVGFGPRIFGRRWGTTDYRLSAIPLGGYVKLGGDESNAPIEGEGATDIPPGERFDLRPRWQKFLVAVAGPVANVLTALAIPFFGAVFVGMPAEPSPVVRYVAPGGAADNAGIKPGDRIVSFNGQDDPTWRKIELDAALHPEQPLALVVDRDGQRLSLTIKPTRSTKKGEAIGLLDLQPDFGNVPVIVGAVEPGTPAAEAGLQPGDRILAVNGEPARNNQQVKQYIQDHKTEPVRITIERGGQRHEVTATVRRLSDGTERIGISFGGKLPLERVGLGEAASYAVSTNVEIIRATAIALGQVFSGQRKMSETLAGPIGIAQVTSDAAETSGLSGVISILGFLSLNLGIFNLLPIPVLDGGAIFLLFVEAVLGLVGLKLTMNMRERIQQAGFVALLLLMGFVITNDLMKMVSRWGSADDNKPAITSPK